MSDAIPFTLVDSFERYLRSKNRSANTVTSYWRACAKPRRSSPSTAPP